MQPAKRDSTVDVMRIFGGLVVMAAHVPLPAWLFQLRNFGTPMMIIVSALATTTVWRDGGLPGWGFVRRRIAKLTLAPWSFLTLFFGAAAVLSSLRHRAFPFTANEVIETYTFQGGIGYVWIFQVYIIVALLTPFLMRFKARFQDPRAYGLMLLAAVAFDEVLRQVVHAAVRDPGWIGRIDSTVLAVIPYAVLFSFGLSLRAMGDEAIARVAVVALAVFAGLAAFHAIQSGRFVPTQAFKYPPTVYYLSYALASVCSVYLVARKAGEAITPPRWLAWVSANMVWVYLWHIVGIYAWHLVFSDEHASPLLMLAELVWVIGLAVLATAIQEGLRSADFRRAGRAVLSTALRACIARVRYAAVGP